MLSTRHLYQLESNIGIRGIGFISNQDKLDSGVSATLLPHYHKLTPFGEMRWDRAGGTTPSNRNPLACPNQPIRL